MNLHGTRDDFIEDMCLKREIYSMPLISLISLGYFPTNHFSDVYQLLFNGREKKLNVTIDQIL